MSIEINYYGELGNHLFQYTFARLLAEKNGIYLKTKWDYTNCMKATEHKDGKIFTHPIRYIKYFPPRNILPHNIPNLPHPDIRREKRVNKIFDKPLEDGRYVLNGFFENPDFFNDNEELIKSFFVLKKVRKNTKDIVISLRLGNDWKGCVLHPDYYLSVLEKEKFRRLYIVGSRKDEPYLKYFKKYDPIIVPTDPINDFYFIMKFDKIVCSNSTYCWWAAFFSEANHIYIPDKWLSPFITSCKDSILVKAKILKGYVSITNYDRTRQRTLIQKARLRWKAYLKTAKKYINH